MYPSQVKNWKVTVNNLGDPRGVKDDLTSKVVINFRT